MEKASGLDVHKDSVFACILDGQGNKIFEQRFGTLTPELTALRDTLPMPVAESQWKVLASIGCLYGMFSRLIFR